MVRRAQQRAGGADAAATGTCGIDRGQPEHLSTSQTSAIMLEARRAGRQADRRAGETTISARKMREGGPKLASPRMDEGWQKRGFTG